MRSFHPVYNPLMAIKVLERVRSAHPDATLVMGGQDKGMLAEVERYARARGLLGALRLTGFLDMEGKLREGTAADIFVNTSHVDNMPVAVLEACALGMPVVSTAVGGITDLLCDGETALLSPDDDVEAMAVSIQRLLREPDRVANLSAAGRRLAERSGWEQVRPEWEGLFATLMARGARPEIGRDRVRH
jgi:glycosyltransferase involved in cell wall biosynthesis